MRDKFICDCCGGAINRVTGKCEYCGTAYRVEEDHCVRIVTSYNPVQPICSKVVFQKDFIAEIGLEKASELAVERLCHSIARGLSPFIKIRTNPLMSTEDVEFEGEVRIVQPIQEEF